MKNLFAKLGAALLINGVALVSAVAAPCVTGTADDFTYRASFASECVADSGNPGNSFSVFSQNYSELVKFNDPQSAPVGKTFTGSAMAFGTAPNNGTITFGLKFLGIDIGGYYGYELLVTDSPESLVPALLDLVGVVKQAKGYQAYRFDNAFIGDNGNLGTFKSLFGPNANNDFSHFSIYGRNYQVCTDNTPGCRVPDDDFPMPEPGSLALVGLGLMGAALVRRRKHTA